MKFSAHSPSFGVLLSGALACLLSASLPALADPAGVATAPPSAPATPAADESFGEVVSVSLTFFRSRLVDGSGRPILGLEPKDLAVDVAGKEVPVLALDWYADPLPLAAEIDQPDSLAAAPRHRVSHRGQLFVFLVDAGVIAAGYGAEIEARRQYLAAVRGLVDSLPEGAYAAVLLRDTHLKLRLDFTTDRKLVSRAIQEAVRSGGPEPSPAGENGARPFLADHFDENRARLAVTTDGALGETARALEALPGEKVLLYLRLGPGRFEETQGAAISEEMLASIQALQAARTSFFALDHYVQGAPARLTMEQIALSTGGLYVPARPDPHPAAKRVAQTVSGYYLVTLDPAALPQEKTPQRMTVKLKGKKGMVLSTPLWTVTGNEAARLLRSTH